MRFSTRTTYGLRAMIFLAQEWNKDFLSLPKIAKREIISQPYLERLFAKLKKAKLLISEKGKTGGYMLAKSPKKITVFDIVKELEGDITPFHCIKKDGQIVCKTKTNCGASHVLLKVQKSINQTLKSITLNDLL